MTGPELQETPDPKLRGELSPWLARGSIALLVALWLGLASHASVARAQDTTGPRAPECAENFSDQVADVLWLRDLDPQGDGSRKAEPAHEPSTGTELDPGTRFGLAVVIGDLLQLRAQAGTAGWPRTLSMLSSQELRRRRDAPALDGIACEIVRFMRERYESEREREGTPAVRRAVREAARVQLAGPSRPAQPPPPRPTPRVVATAGPAPAGARPTPPVKTPAPAPDPPKAPTPPAPARVEPSAALPPRPPVQVQSPRPDRPAAEPPPEVVEKKSFAPVAPPQPLEPTPQPLEPTPEPLVAPAQPLEPTPPPEPQPTPQVGPSPGQVAAAKSALAGLETQLAAPRYLTLRTMRKAGASRPDDEVWRSRRSTMEARDELVRLLRELAATPDRHAAVKSLLGRQGCLALETRIADLFAGGPGSEMGQVALEMWSRQPNPS